MNRIDYNRLFEREALLHAGKKLLLHCCCAPCTLGVIEKATEFFDVTLFWFNPNIMPESECDKRLGELYKIAKIYGVDIIEGGYPSERFMEFALPMKEDKEGGERCRSCLAMRIYETGDYASSHGYDLFTTTLTVSPHKNSERINLIGEKYEGSAKWLHGDFKKKGGFDRSTELCEKYGIYRQSYCGCKL